MLDRRPHPQSVFNREDDQRKILDRVECPRVTRGDRGHRFERDRNQIDQDQSDQKPVGDYANALANRALFEGEIDVPAQVVHRKACHAASSRIVSCKTIASGGGRLALDQDARTDSGRSIAS
ncbi:MAG: hypothetical protein Q8K85_11810 [Hyphomicrobium sp.]|nr:hypothetical protein [Hyphomicrobium sp.]